MTKHTDGWTLRTLAIHQDALRAADETLALERDRRYAEGASLRAEALKIKETADLAALTLARESQTYKEQQADAMRDKTLGESGLYATTTSVNKMFDDVKTHLDEALIPVFRFINKLEGATGATTATSNKQIAQAGLFIAAGAVIMKLLGV